MSEREVLLFSHYCVGNAAFLYEMHVIFDHSSTVYHHLTAPANSARTRGTPFWLNIEVVSSKAWSCYSFNKLVYVELWFLSPDIIRFAYIIVSNLGGWSHSGDQMGLIVISRPSRLNLLTTWHKVYTAQGLYRTRSILLKVDTAQGR